MAESFSQEDERRRALMDAVFREHFVALHHYISDKVRQPDVADDLTSQVFLKAFRWLREDRGIGQVRSWLYTTARTTIADYWQEQQKSLFIPLERIEEHAADTPLTPRTKQILELAGKRAGKQGEQAISPTHILHALLDEKRGIAVQMLRSMGIDLDSWQETQGNTSDEEIERYVRRLEHWVEQTPQVSEEEERQLAHLVARSRAEQRRAELLKETPDALLLSEGESAYDRLVKVSQHLVLTVAKDYFKPERDKREIIIAGNRGLSRAISTFGLKKQTSFRSYAMHMIHLQIIEILE